MITLTQYEQNFLDFCAKHADNVNYRQNKVGNQSASSLGQRFLAMLNKVAKRHALESYIDTPAGKDAIRKAENAGTVIEPTREDLKPFTREQWIIAGMILDGELVLTTSEVASIESYVASNCNKPVSLTWRDASIPMLVMKPLLEAYVNRSNFMNVDDYNFFLETPIQTRKQKSLVEQVIDQAQTA